MADFFGITDTGKVRDNNEDAFIAEQVFDDKFIIACAIDGVGGYAGGEIAAEIARQSILEKFSKRSGDIISAMKESFLAANDKIVLEKQRTPELAKMACVLTLAVVDVENNQFYYAHIGDTRLYLWRDGSLVKVSKDHSFVGFLEDSGRLDEKAAMTHLKRNEINKALGFGTEINNQEGYIDTGVSPFLPGDMILLCSDGLTDMVPKEQIISVLNTQLSIKEKAGLLIEKANKNGGKDNITVVLVENTAASSFQAVPAVAKADEAALSQKPSIASTETRKPGPAIIDRHLKDSANVNRPRNNSAVITILSLLCLVFLSSTLYLFWKSSEEASEQPQEIAAGVTDNRNPDEVKLQDAINSLVGDTLVLVDSAYSQPILLTDTLTIGQDSLYILAKGKITIKADSSFAGPAIFLLGESKHVLMEGITFDGFDVAISSPNNALALKNVQFVNCSRSVQNFFSAEDNQKVTGKVKTGFVPLDTISTQ